MTLQLILMLASLSTYGNDISIDNLSLDRERAQVSFSLSWKNAWHNDKNHDAAWVFIKLQGSDGNFFHAKLKTSEHRAVAQGQSPEAVVKVSDDKIGAFVQSSTKFRGDVSWNLTVELDKSIIDRTPLNTEIKVYAIEMVYIPEGGFTLGDPDPAALKYASFYESDDSGQPKGLFSIESEDQQIKIAPESGALYHQPGEQPIYTGDRTGIVPSSFPKGFKAFYIMKYEVTQGIYSDFLNSIPPSIAAQLTPHQTEGYYTGRGSIRFENGKYLTTNPNRPCNWITWDDGASFADWAGLRPLTELEFTKAARGPGEPIAHEFPWGTDNKNTLSRKVDLDDDLKLTNGVSESDLNENNRHVYGASYYWVMDLAGSLWEKCVTIGHPIGRDFKGTHGDGTLATDGRATNADWPKGTNEEGGYGYRGGGYYQHDMRIGEYNPHSPIAYRPYGSWAGGKRSIAYSQRYVRTAN